MFKFIMIFAAGFGCAVVAHAQTLADQSLQLDAQISIVQKQKQLADQLGPDPILSKVPKVVSVMSFGVDTKAKLMLANGVVLTYGEGEVINQRMRVVAITPREVVVAISPSDSVGGKKGKAKDPVLMPLEFMAGATTQNQTGTNGLPGTPGTPVGPIPPGLMQPPPSIPGGNLASWPQPGGAGQPAAAGPVPAPAPAAVPTGIAEQAR